MIRVDFNMVGIAWGGRAYSFCLPVMLEPSCWRYAIRELGLWRAVKQRGFA
jgi:hypothetical protein